MAVKSFNFLALAVCAFAILSPPALGQSLQGTPPTRLPPAVVTGPERFDFGSGSGSGALPNLICPAAVSGRLLDGGASPQTPGVDGATMQLRGSAGVVATTQTDANGRFTFAAVCSGDYAVGPAVTRYGTLDLAFVDWQAWHPEFQLVSVGTKSISDISIELRREEAWVDFGVRRPETGDLDPDIRVAVQVFDPNGEQYGQRTVLGHGSGWPVQCCGRHSFVMSHPEHRFTNYTIDIQPETPDQVILMEPIAAR